MRRLNSESGCCESWLLLAAPCILVVCAMAATHGLCGGLMAGGALLLVALIFSRVGRRPRYACRALQEVLAEVDRLDEREASEDEFQTCFDELLFHLTAGPTETLEAEIRRRIQLAEGPSRRLFLQLASLHPALRGDLKELSESAHPLAPEAKELLERRSDES